MNKVVTLLFMMLCLPLYSQTQFCASTEVHNHLKNNDAKYFSKYNEAQQKMYQSLASQKNANNTTVYTIPVVVHVVHTGEPLGTGKNPTDAQIQNYINMLNQAFSATFPGHPTASSGGVDIGIQFVLAQRTPNCTATNGINRINASSNSSYVTNGISVFNNPIAINHQQLANYSYWDRNEYLNIWLVNKIYEGWSGWGFYPGNYNPIEDGVIIVGNDVINSGTPYLVAHELGHAFDLRHTFEEDLTGYSCPPNSNCLTQGDLVCDTDPVNQNIDCASNSTNICTGLPLGTLGVNYMNYSCHQLFTQGQKDRMRNALLTLRPTLINSLGGLPPAQVSPSINISTISNTICQGQTISFTSNTSNGGNSATYQWYVNNNIVGSNSNTFSFVPSNNDVVYCKLTSSNFCALPQNVNSNSITVSVIPTVQLSANLTSSATTVCQGTQVTATVSNNGFNNPSYTWYVNQSPVSTTTIPSFSFYPTNYETLFCRITENSPTNCQSSTFINSNLIYYVAIPQPTQPLVIQIDNYLKVTNYLDGQGQWHNGSTAQPIAGATNQIFYPTASGLYYYVVNNNGCFSQSPYIQYTYLSVDEVEANNDFRIYPNPSDNILNIDVLNKQINKIEIFDLQGRLLKTIKESKEKYQIDISNFTSATYVLKITTEKGSQSVKIIKK
jgi:hypothetical protein